ncbi:CCR4-NOT transcription complex subunit 10-like [Daphnia pulicaria]|uniref:CCR4-NOT transcription complex subunit 10-like n=1 Tax=Daphnia pulicaria TaxID=35523 RepID=UPI001EEB2229|nr:CCR4-NOT transcription complex subunit 10-like [Daphnia pulicaria]
MADTENYDAGSENSSQASEQEKALALGAQAEFEKKNYAAAIQLLSKLESSRPQDPKVIHNKAIVNCFKAGLTNISQLRKALTSIAKQLQCNLEDPKTLVDVDQCYVFYNEAVTLYFLRQYPKTLQILTKIFSLVEQLDESLARQVCFLLAEVYLRLNFPIKTLKMVHFMETSLLSHGAKLKSTLPLERERDKEKDCEGKEDLKSSFGDELLIPPGVRIRLQRLKIRANLSISKREEAERELALLSEIDPENAATLFLKSKTLFVKANYAESLKQFKLPEDDGLFKERGESDVVMYHNNTGCVYHAMGKYHLACLHFQKSLNKSSELLAEFPKPVSGDPISNRPLVTIGSNYKYELLYNMGVSLLYARKPADAFDCLIETVQLHHRDPLIWLRLAECCIQVHKPENRKDFRLTERQREIVKATAGFGSHRKVILSSRISNDNCKSSENAAIPVPTLEFGTLALRNAELLLNKLTIPNSTEDVGNKDESDSKGKPDLNVTLSEVSTLSKLRKPEFYRNLKNTIIADSSYAALCLGDYLTSLYKAEELLTQPHLSGNHKLLGHLYAAESLVLLNRINEAVPHLHPENVTKLSNFSPSESEITQHLPHTSDWFPLSTQTAKVVLQYNLSTVYAMRGEYDKAGELVRQLWNASKSHGIDVPIQVVTLALYVELQLGRTEIARNIIKQHCPQYR